MHLPSQALELPESRTDTYTTIIVLAFLLFLSIGTKPFMNSSGVEIDMSGAGERPRQIILLSIFAFATPLLVIRRQRLLQIILANRSVLLLFAWALLSISWSDVKDIAARRILGTLLVATLTILATTLPLRRIVSILLVLTGTIMIINFLGVIFIPELALLPEGMWKGLHMHKNSAGYFSAISALLWLFIGHSRRSRWLLMCGVAWVIFLWFTHSRTCMAIFFIMLPLGIFFGRGIRFGFDRRVILLLLWFGGLVFPLFIYLALNLWVGFFGNKNFSYIDLTFTGRTEIWQFVWKSILQSPFLGTGYGAFWAIGDRSPALMRASEFVAQYTEAHNGYLDILVSLGTIGLLLTVAALVQPYSVLWTYRSSHIDTSTREVLLCALLMLTFGIIQSIFESTLLQGLNILWTLMLLSIWVITSRILSYKGFYHTELQLSK
jgi:exopolysaccharide production protein ExoQ